MSRALSVAAALLAAAPALAQQSPRWGSVDVGAGTYRPNVDSEAFPTLPAGSEEPYRAVFGGGRGWAFHLGVSRALFTRVGSLEVGLRTGYFQDSGHAIDPVTNEPTIDETKLRIIPTSVSLLYRFDWPVERYKIPLAPYGRVAFERYNWWVTDGGGDTVERGATMGWSATGGLALLLDIVDPVLAREFDRDSGVNHTYLFFEVTKSFVDDFGSSSSWDLSDEDLSLTGGVTFVF